MYLDEDGHVADDEDERGQHHEHHADQHGVQPVLLACQAAQQFGLVFGHLTKVRCNEEQHRHYPTEDKHEQHVGSLGYLLVKRVEDHHDEAVDGDEAGVPQRRAHEQDGEMHHHLAHRLTHGPAHHEVGHQHQQVVDTQVDNVVDAKTDNEHVGDVLQVSFCKDDDGREGVGEDAPK